LAALATQRREDDEWNYDEGTDEIGLSAHALMEYLKEDGEWNDKQSEIDDVEFQIEDLRSEMENDPEVIADPNGERAQDYGMDLNNLEEEIETLRQEAHDVYDIIYEEYRHYGLPVFEYDGAEYAVGDDKMADDAAYEQVESLIDEIGYTGFREGFADWYVDADVVANDFEDMFWEDMYDRPEDYLDEDEDMELTSDAKKDLENIDENIGNFMEELEETDDEFMREEIEDKISYLQSEKEEIEEDEDNYEFTQEAKENYVENQMQEVRNDPMGYLRDYGWDENIDRYIDKDAFIEGVLEYDSRGNGLSGYDGEEREVEFDDEWYYIYRIN
jgi:DNA repair exonuclease SbcCD ATPase subunit